MQLQKSLFSFYKVFIRKTPLIAWILFAVIFLVIITWQVKQFYSNTPVYNFDKCMMQYFNATRPLQNDTIPIPLQNDTIINDTSKAEQKKFMIPFKVQAQYYNILNETSTIKVYLSDEIEFKQGQPNCKIILNTQKLRPKQEDKQKQNKTQSNGQKQNNQDKQKQAVVKLLQQIDDQKKISQQDSNKNILIDQKSQQSQKKQHEQKQQRPVNVINYDQVTDQEHKFLLNQHSFMHITANAHVVYLDQNNQFEQKHNVHIHALILSRQSVNEYPDSLFGISSKLWRWHGNQLISMNANMVRSMGQTFFNVKQIVLDIYLRTLDNLNQVIAINKLKQMITDAQNKANQNKSVDQKNNNLSTDQTKQQTQPQKSAQTNQQKQTPSQDSKQQSTQKSTFPIQLLFPQQINPLSSLKLYFHYPQTLRIQDINHLVNTINSSFGLVYKLFTIFLFCAIIYVMSMIVGLLVRYLFFGIITIYLFLGGCYINKQWGWVYKYYALIKNRWTQQNTFSSVKMLILFAIALIGTMGIFAIGTKYILENLFIISLPFIESYYSQMLLKNYFVIQMFYYVCCRTRTSLRFFPIFSSIITVLILFVNDKLYCYHISWLLNLHLIAHLFLMVIFAAIQNYIGNSQFFNQYTPCLDKPRAMYYAGYDISWENTLPPIWTYFSTNFDLKHFGQRQKALINRDYQLLYGRLLGMNERQQLPEDEDNIEEQEQSNELNQNLNQNLSENEIWIIQDKYKDIGLGIQE